MICVVQPTSVTVSNTTVSVYTTEVIADRAEYETCDPRDGMHCKTLLPLEHLSASQQWDNILGNYRLLHTTCKTPAHVRCCVGCTQKSIPHLSVNVLYGQKKVREFVREVIERARERNVEDVVYVLNMFDLREWDRLIGIDNVVNVEVVDHSLALLEFMIEEQQRMSPKERQEDWEEMQRYVPAKDEPI